MEVHSNQSLGMYLIALWTWMLDLHLIRYLCILLGLFSKSLPAFQCHSVRIHFNPSQTLTSFSVAFCSSRRLTALRLFPPSLVSPRTALAAFNCAEYLSAILMVASTSFLVLEAGYHLGIRKHHSLWFSSGKKNQFSHITAVATDESFSTLVWDLRLHFLNVYH